MPVRAAITAELRTGADLKDLVVLVHSFSSDNSTIIKLVQESGLTLAATPFIPMGQAYVFNKKRCNKALAWSVGYDIGD